MPGKTSCSTFELKRNRTRKRSGAAPRIVRNWRAIGTRHAATATATPMSDSARDQHRRSVDAAALQRLRAEDRAERGEEHVVQDDGASLGHEPDRDLDQQQYGGRHERDDEREEHDVRRRRATHREELGVLAEDVEERLRQRESGHGEAAERRAPRARASRSWHQF